MTRHAADIVEWDRIAVREAVRVVDLAGDDDWGRDSPCAGSGFLQGGRGSILGGEQWYEILGPRDAQRGIE
ncbi:hypothetical protein ACWC19_35450, partial [Streptomyces sp. 900105245]